MKRCARCDVEKPLSDFYRLGSGYTYSYCRPCASERNSERPNYARPPYDFALDGPAQRKHKLKKKFGLTVEDYEEILAAQNGVCAICGRPERRRSKHGEIKALAVDHDHETGAIRGLLCHDCNVGVGYLGDSLERLMDAAVYFAKARDNNDSAKTPPLLGTGDGT